MDIENGKIESFVKSFAFSLVLCVVWGCFTYGHVLRLLGGFDFVELLWVVYNVTITLLFLVRERPAAVSMNPVHWVVALVTSFSGFFFSSEIVCSNAVVLSAAEVILVLSILLGIVTAFVLGRSYDFAPALRGVKTGFVYRFVRHPMYLSSIVIKSAYVLKHPSIWNLGLLVFAAVLYDRRARYEEDIMSGSDLYVEYLREVRYRFVWGVY